MRALSPLVVIAMAVGLVACSSAPRPFGKPETDSINQLIGEFVTVYNAKDAARLSRLFTDGGAVMPPNASMQRHISGLDVPHKTGDTDQVRTECALFPLQSRVVACVLTKENVDQRYLIDNEAQVMMARMGEAIAGAWPRRAPAPAPR